MATSKSSKSIRDAVGANNDDLLRFEAALKANPKLRADFLRAPDATMRTSGFAISGPTATVLTNAVREALRQHGNPNATDFDVSITTRISVSAKPAGGAIK